MFQKIVNRNYTGGFPGQVANYGPYRAKPGRITSLVGNVMSRVFGVSGEVPPTGTTQAAQEVTAEVGGVAYLGILGHPQHHVLYGTANGGPLAASDELPAGTEAEFFDMVTGMFVELFNETTAVKTVAYGDKLCYVTTATSSAQNPQGIPVGGLVSVPAGGTTPAGFADVPGGFVRQAVTIGASAAGAPVSTYTNVQLTH